MQVFKTAQVPLQNVLCCMLAEPMTCIHKAWEALLCYAHCVDISLEYGSKFQSDCLTTTSHHLGYLHVILACIQFIQERRFLQALLGLLASRQTGLRVLCASQISAN